MRRVKGLLLAVVCCVCVSLPLTAQKVTGTIAGVVTDQAGAVVSGAEVTAKNAETGTSRSAKSGAGGDYAIAHLPAGTYDGSVKQSRIRRFVSKESHLVGFSTR